MSPEPKKLHRWERGGEEWACAEYDHGPFCRLCVKITSDATRLCLDNVERGYCEIVEQGGSDGFRFRVTPEGERVVKGLLNEN